MMPPLGLRRRFHPAGFALAHAFLALTWVWFPMLLGWAAKAIILRFGGMKQYRAGIPFFIGLILGDIVIGVLWSLIGAALGMDIYMFFPG
jgi:ABC-type nickel/cobalt efflux system permease component RcnA